MPALCATKANPQITDAVRSRISDFIVFDDDDLTNIGEYYALIIGIQDYEFPEEDRSKYNL